MVGWMDINIEGWLDGWILKIDGYKNGRLDVYKKMDGLADKKQRDGLDGKKIDGWMDRQDKWMVGLYCKNI